MHCLNLDFLFFLGGTDTENNVSDWLILCSGLASEGNCTSSANPLAVRVLNTVDRQTVYKELKNMLRVKMRVLCTSRAPLAVKVSNTMGC